MVFGWPIDTLPRSWPSLRPSPSVSHFVGSVVNAGRTITESGLGAGSSSTAAATQFSEPPSEYLTCWSRGVMTRMSEAAPPTLLDAAEPLVATLARRVPFAAAGKRVPCAAVSPTTQAFGCVVRAVAAGVTPYPVPVPVAPTDPTPAYCVKMIVILRFAALGFT